MAREGYGMLKLIQRLLRRFLWAAAWIIPMALSMVSVAAATAVLNYDLLSGRPDIAVSGANRVIRALGLTGSAAAGDTSVDVKVGNVTVSTLFNTATGFPTADAAKFPTQYFVPAGTPISVIVTDAPVTNAINLLIDV
jgi:hypothetical protein